MATYGNEGGYAFNEDQRGGHTESGIRVERVTNKFRGIDGFVQQRFDEVIQELQPMIKKAGECDQVRATLYVNFVTRKTLGVQIPEHEADQASTHGLLFKILSTIHRSLNDE